VYGVFGPSTEETPAGMTNPYYYHSILDTDNNPASGFDNSEYEGNATNLQTPIGVDLVVQFGWRNGDADGVYAYDALTEVDLFEDYEYTIEGDTIHAIIPLEYLGLAPGQVIAVSVFQEGASNGWQVDWVESFELTLKDTSAQASDPIPVMDSNDIERDVILTWISGEFAAEHNVYLGTDWTDVNDASPSNPLGVLLSQGQIDPSFDTGRLEFNQTYFWRVDEVNGTPDKTVFKGDVWSFEVEPYSIQIPGSTIAATASSTSNEFSTPERTIDGSGLDANDAHDASSENMWFTGPVDLAPWIQYEFDAVEKLDIMTVWNSNSAAEMAIGWGVKDVEIAYSVDGETWDVLANANQFNRAPGLPTYNQVDEIDFGGAAAKAVRLNVQSNWGGILMAYGLSEVQFSMIPAAARSAEPASGSVDVLPDAMLSWRAGREAAQHTIYVGTDQNDVADGLAPSVTANTNSLDVSPLDLELDQTYYWRVDEVNETEAVSVWAGPVWSFSTADALTVDDFESYRNVSPNRPFQTWHDGFGYSADEFFSGEYSGNGTGAGIGHDIWSLSSPHYNGDLMETGLVYSGAQSMPVYYDGAGSQVDLPLDSRDWTQNDIQTLSIAFHGTAGNTGQLYAKINDTKLLYDQDPGDIANGSWLVWQIDLSSVSGLENVTVLSIGVDGAGAAGTLYLDDIKLYAKEPRTN